MSMSGWDRAKELADQHSQGSGLFVQLSDDGDKMVCMFVGDPLPKEVHWIESDKKYVDCVGKPECQPCVEKGPALRIAINIFIPEEKAIKIWEFGTRVFNDIVKVGDKYGLDDQLFEVQRHGEKGDSKTVYSILPESKLEGENLEVFKTLQPHDLTKDASERGGGDDVSSAGQPNGENKVIKAEHSQKLVERLKQLPRAKVDEFLKKFEITRVKDLKTPDLQAAVAFVKDAETERDGAQQEEVDPFA